MDIFESLENLNISEECFDEIMDIVEEYIHEVSVNMWKKTAINSLAGRGYEQGRMGETIDRVFGKKKWSDKDREKLRKLSNTIERTEHAKEVANLPNSKMSANKVLGAAKKVIPSRWEAVLKGETTDKANERNDRLSHAEELLPVKKEF